MLAPHLRGGAANSVKSYLRINLNGTNYNYNGSATRNVNLNASTIGAAPTSHTHTSSDITDLKTGCQIIKTFDGVSDSAETCELNISDINLDEWDDIILKFKCYSGPYRTETSGAQLALRIDEDDTSATTSHYSNALTTKDTTTSANYLIFIPCYFKPSSENATIDELYISDTCIKLNFAHVNVTGYNFYHVEGELILPWGYGFPKYSSGITWMAVGNRGSTSNSYQPTCQKLTLSRRSSTITNRFTIWDIRLTGIPKT